MPWYILGSAPHTSVVLAEDELTVLEQLVAMYFHADLQQR